MIVFVKLAMLEIEDALPRLSPSCAFGVRRRDAVVDCDCCGLSLLLSWFDRDMRIED